MSIINVNSTTTKHAIQFIDPALLPSSISDSLAVAIRSSKDVKDATAGFVFIKLNDVVDSTSILSKTGVVDVLFAGSECFCIVESEVNFSITWKVGVKQHTLKSSGLTKYATLYSGTEKAVNLEYPITATVDKVEGKYNWWKKNNISLAIPHLAFDLTDSSRDVVTRENRYHGAGNTLPYELITINKSSEAGSPYIVNYMPISMLPKAAQEALDAYNTAYTGKLYVASGCCKFVAVHIPDLVSRIRSGELAVNNSFNLDTITAFDGDNLILMSRDGCTYNFTAILGNNQEVVIQVEAKTKLYTASDFTQYSLFNLPDLANSNLNVLGYYVESPQRGNTKHVVETLQDVDIIDSFYSDKINKGCSALTSSFIADSNETVTVDLDATSLNNYEFVVRVAAIRQTGDTWTVIPDSMLSVKNNGNKATATIGVQAGDRVILNAQNYIVGNNTLDVTITRADR